MNDLIIPEFTKQDYYTTSTPFEWLSQFKDNKLKLQQMLSIMREKAGEVGVKNFVTLYKVYLETIKKQNGIVNDNVTDFEGQEIELDCGSWFADDLGITAIDKMGFEVIACNHPVMPIQRLVNIDSGIEKIKIAYKKGRVWRSLIADKKTLASNNSILQLADYGLAVNSENSKHLVKYLTDIEHLNYDRIEELNSVGRLGWIDDYGFSPYVDNIVFDGDISFKHFFESVKQKGDFTKWIETVKEVRKNGIAARLMLAASFSSVLLKPCGALPFFVHLWGGTETGKTVGLMLAASVWADPHMGKYIHTFNSTAVAQELSAGFVNSLPLILDELQIVKDKKDFDGLIYQLTEGIGRARGQKAGGLQRTSTWQNCFLTTGEMPINNQSSGGGAVNRIIEIDCKDTKLFTDPVNVVEVVKKNYGFAGRVFVEMLQDESNMQYMIETQKEIYKKLSQGETTEKQAISASIILTADKLIEEWIFRDGMALKIKDLEQFLSTKSEVSQNERALQYIYDFVSINQNKFNANGFGEYHNEIWGCQDDDYIYIIKSQFDKILQNEGYNSGSFLSWAGQRNMIERENERYSKLKRINGKPVRCIWLKSKKDDESEIPQWVQELEIDEQAKPNV